MFCTETKTKRSMIVIESGPFGLWVKLPPVYHEHWIGFTLPHSNAERQAEKLLIPNFEVSGLTRLGIEREPTISEADALSNQTLFGICAAFFCTSCKWNYFRCSSVLRISNVFATFHGHISGTRSGVPKPGGMGRYIPPIIWLYPPQ